MKKILIFAIITTLIIGASLCFHTKSKTIKVTVYSPNGQPKVTKELKKGRLHGIVTYFYPGGKVRSMWGYKNGLREGVVVKYNLDGKIIGEWNYKNDRLDGAAYIYNSEGALVSEIEYQDGILIGDDGKYFSGYHKQPGMNGSEFHIGYDLGIATGEWKKIDADGNLVIEEKVVEDIYLFRKEYDPESKEVKIYEPNELYSRSLNNAANNILLLGGELKFANELIDKALSVDPKDAIYLTTKSEILFEGGDFVLASEFIDLAINEDPDNESIQRIRDEFRITFEEKEALPEKLPSN